MGSPPTPPGHKPAAAGEPLGPRGEAALFYHDFGYAVIPVVRGQKRPVFPHEPWSQQVLAQGRRAIEGHYRRHPNDDLAFIVGIDQVVFDTDSPEATAALHEIERQHGIEPNSVVETSRGEHHAFRLEPGTYVRSSSHDGRLHPERIDVKAPRGMCNLPPSDGKKVKVLRAANAYELESVGQAFIDDIFRHNAQPPPRPAPARELPRLELDDEQHDERIARLKPLVEAISPNVGYDDWRTVGMAIAYETGASEAGRDLYDAWSSGGHTYPGPDAVDRKWKSFDPAHPNPVRIGSLIDLARQAGADVAQLMGDAFEEVETETVSVEAQREAALAENVTKLDQYSLLGRADLLLTSLVAHVYVLGRLALLGQATFFFAAPGTGKTLITLHLLLECIRLGLISARQVYYLNLDDNPAGLVAKQQLADEYGFHMIAEGYRGFRVSLLLHLLDTMAQDGSAKNTIVLLDTLKKCVNVMDKRECSLFMASVRRFVTKGGTVIGLAHTNKKLDDDGRSVYAGVSDIRDDADCAYVIDPVDGGAETNEQYVTFRNVKSRGNNALSATYAYTRDRDLPYAEFLLSMREVEPEGVPAARQRRQAVPDASVIEAVKACIADGFTSKMRLAVEAGARVGISRAQAQAVMDSYAGDDPLRHHWRITPGGPHGAHVYWLLGPPPADPPEGVSG